MDESENVREAYSDVVDHMLEVEADQDFIDWFQGTTLADFENDNILLQYPRMLTQKENDTLQAGVSSRDRWLFQLI